MKTVADHIEEKIAETLPRFDFESNPTSHFCQKLSKLLKSYVVTVSKEYDDEIEKYLKSEFAHRSRSDLVSWCVSELHEIIRSALGDLSRFIWNTKSFEIPPTRKISCEMAMDDILKLADFAKIHADAKTENFRKLPLSKKFKKKRGDHDWVPYLFSVDHQGIMRKVIGSN